MNATHHLLSGALFNRSRSTIATILVYGLTMCSASAWSADKYPSHPITYVVPNAAAGSGDIIARILAQPLSTNLGASIVVDNKPGATGIIGAIYTARSKPDGYTLLASSVGPMTIAPELQKTSLDPRTALIPVIEIAEAPVVLVVAANSPFHSVQDIISAARAEPGTVSFASGGTGTLLHLQGELLKKQLGLKITHVPYKGDAPALPDLLSGRISMMFLPVQTASSQLVSGRLRALATTSGTRLKSLPNVPTMAQAGIPDFVNTGWFGVYVPLNTPAPIVNRLNAAFNSTLKDPKVISSFAHLGLQIIGGTSQSFAAAQSADIRRWSDLVKSSGADFAN